MDEALKKEDKRLVKELEALRRRLSELEESEGRLVKEVESLRREADEGLKENERFLSDVFNSIQDGVSILDKNLRIIRVNKTMENWHSHRMPIVGSLCYKAYHGKTEICERCPSVRTLQSGQPAYEIVPLRGAQVEGWVELFTFPLINSRTEEVIGVIEYVRDITEKQSAMRELFEEKNKLEAFLAGIGDAISVQDSSFRVMYQNQVHKDLVGGDFAGQICYKAYQKADKICSGCPVAMGFEDGKIHKVQRIMEREKGALHVEVTASPLRDASGKVIAGVEVIRDVTDRKRQEAELQTTQKLDALRTMTSGIAHDFNNILTAIIGNISLARMYSLAGEMSDILNEAEKASIKATHLANQLFTFSRGGALVKNVFPVGRLLKNCLSVVPEGISGECSIAPDLWSVEADEGQITEVFNHLASNARQAMPSGGVIRLKAENITLGAEDHGVLGKGDYVKVTVQDEGVGIPKESLHKIFDPFFTTKRRSNGLGLAITYSIIRDHGGHIEVESEPRAGTTFTVYLPATRKKHREEEEKEVVFGRGRILVMDDEEVVRVVVGRMLVQCGYDADIAKEGGEAVRLFKKAVKSGAPYSAVILDLIVAEGVDGVETLKQMRKANPDVRAIASSGNYNDPIMSHPGDYGFKGVLAKPFVIRDLGLVLHKVLKGGK